MGAFKKTIQNDMSVTQNGRNLNYHSPFFEPGLH